MTTNHPSVALLHMADGKTVIARVSYDGPDGLKLNRPCELLVSLERGTGRKQIDFAPYLSILNTTSCVVTSSSSAQPLPTLQTATFRQCPESSLPSRCDPLPPLVGGYLLCIYILQTWRQTATLPINQICL
jgi:hypothetical protein